jgi:hypothetical protein
MSEVWIGCIHVVLSIRCIFAYYLRVTPIMTDAVAEFSRGVGKGGVMNVPTTVSQSITFAQSGSDGDDRCVTIRMPDDVDVAGVDLTRLTMLMCVYSEGSTVAGDVREWSLERYQPRGSVGNWSFRARCIIATLPASSRRRVDWNKYLIQFRCNGAPISDWYKIATAQTVKKRNNQVQRLFQQPPPADGVPRVSRMWRPWWKQAGICGISLCVETTPRTIIAGRYNVTNADIVEFQLPPALSLTETAYFEIPHQFRRHDGPVAVSVEMSETYRTSRFKLYEWKSIISLPPRGDIFHISAPSVSIEESRSSVIGTDVALHIYTQDGMLTRQVMHSVSVSGIKHHVVPCPLVDTRTASMAWAVDGVEIDDKSPFPCIRQLATYSISDDRLIGVDNLPVCAPFEITVLNDPDHTQKGACVTHEVGGLGTLHFGSTLCEPGRVYVCHPSFVRKTRYFLGYPDNDWRAAAPFYRPYTAVDIALARSMQTRAPLPPPLAPSRKPVYFRVPGIVAATSLFRAQLVVFHGATRVHHNLRYEPDNDRFVADVDASYEADMAHLKISVSCELKKYPRGFVDVDKLDTHDWESVEEVYRTPQFPLASLYTSHPVAVLHPSGVEQEDGGPDEGLLRDEHGTPVEFPCALTNLGMSLPAGAVHISLVRRRKGNYAETVRFPVHRYTNTSACFFGDHVPSLERHVTFEYFVTYWHGDPMEFVVKNDVTF